MVYHKVMTRWTPHTLTDHYRAAREAICGNLFVRLHRHYLLESIISGNEAYFDTLFRCPSVYVTEFVINQGLLELIIFDCNRRLWRKSKKSVQMVFRWCIRFGVFISRSSIKFVQFNMTTIAFVLPLLQFLNMVFLIFNAIYAFVPHFAIMCAIVLYEGLIGGASYVNTFNHIHRKVDPAIREFALSTVIIGDTIGLLTAGILAIPIHNAICAMPWYS
ncbi:hypothetical protein KIN20_012798 [Parelaphostrongylus tenuis]|uniref:Battenin n=1 Tax=Parelaphostrongylus tenuis TaxID=148309 RepID=A0AAD5QN18_PARTN|nr:hypothetical protein KIN20_012798 [Parelaphostrongylus tenuis]